MFRRSAKPEAIKGDVIGETLVEVRERIELHGWTAGGQISGEFSKMCLGNHIAIVAGKKSKVPLLSWNLPLWTSPQPWVELDRIPLGQSIITTLGFWDKGHLAGWNDHLSRRKGAKEVIKRINESIELHNKDVIHNAQVAALKEDAEREKLCVPAGWKPRTVSGEVRKKVTV